MKRNKKKIIITLSVIIPLILILSLTAAFIKWQSDPEVKLKLSGKNVIHTVKYEDYNGVKEIYVCEKEGVLDFEVYERDVYDKVSGLLGFLGTEIGKAQRINIEEQTFLTDYYKPCENSFLYVNDTVKENESLNVKLKAFYVQKAPENAKQGEFEFENYEALSEIIEHEGEKYQLISLKRIINHGMNNLSTDEIIEFANKINK